jgi:hypothetical protein
MREKRRLKELAFAAARVEADECLGIANSRREPDLC